MNVRDCRTRVSWQSAAEVGLFVSDLFPSLPSIRVANRAEFDCLVRLARYFGQSIHVTSFASVFASVAMISHIIGNFTCQYDFAMGRQMKTSNRFDAMMAISFVFRLH